MTDLADIRDDTGPFLGWPADPDAPPSVTGECARPAHPDTSGATTANDPAAPRAPGANGAVTEASVEVLAPLPDGLAPLVALLASRTVDPDTIREMQQIQREHHDARARAAYAGALARFRRVAPTLDKDREVVVELEDSRGGRTPDATTSYRYTSLGHAMETINPLLGELDLNLSWHPRVEDGIVHVETRLTHALGHSESVSLPGAPDASGGKNAIQAMKSTVSYLERTGALALLGLAARDDDDDGRGATTECAAAPATDLLSDAEADALNGLLDQVERRDPGARRRWFAHYGGVFAPADNALGLAIPADLFDRAEAQLVNRLAERRAS